MTTGRSCAVSADHAPATARTDYCKNCNHVFYYWSKRPVARVVGRREFLSMSQTRMAHVAEVRHINADGKVERPAATVTRIRPPSGARPVSKKTTVALRRGRVAP
jgi:hypothetical protein